MNQQSYVHKQLVICKTQLIFFNSSRGTTIKRLSQTAIELI